MALAMGVTIAGALAWTIAALMGHGCTPKYVAQRALEETSRGSTLTLGAVAIDGECQSAEGGMQLTSTSTQRYHDPLTSFEQDPGSRTAVATLGNGMDLKIVEVSLLEQGAEIRIVAAYSTDYGDFPGHVREAGSTVHLHNDRLCFDLSVDRLDGSGFVERWVGAIPFSHSQ